jgi:hypothetical protein
VLWAFLAVTVTACAADQVRVPTPELDADEERACRALVADLPETLAGADRVEVEPSDAPAAAWGEPPVVLSCGGEVPDNFGRTAFCQEVNGVGWYVPDAALADEARDVTMVTVGYLPIVTVEVPAELRPEGLATVSAELAAPVAEHTDLVRPCL